MSTLPLQTLQELWRESVHNSCYIIRYLQASSHAERLFRLIDIDGDGRLTKTEFLRVRFTTNVFIWKIRGACLQGCLQDSTLLTKLDKIIDSCQPPTAFQSTYYWVTRCQFWKCLNWGGGSYWEGKATESFQTCRQWMLNINVKYDNLI